jgi:hypothetical protein
MPSTLFTPYWLVNFKDSAEIKQRNKDPIPFIMENFYRDFPCFEPLPKEKRGGITVLDVYKASNV